MLRLCSGLIILGSEQSSCSRSGIKMELAREIELMGIHLHVNQQKSKSCPLYHAFQYLHFISSIQTIVAFPFSPLQIVAAADSRPLAQAYPPPQLLLP